MLEIKVAGENAAILYFGKTVSDSLLDEIAFYTSLLKQELATVLIDAVPSYTSLLLTYRIEKIDYETLCQQIHAIIDNNTMMIMMHQTEVIEIPVLYDPDVGLDLESYLYDQKLDLDTFISLHSERDYRVHAVGFSPAFAYLGQLERRLMAPRLQTPRTHIPAGSVGIADDQTAVYPVESPGGWQIIGRTPLNLSLENADNLKRFHVGNKVRFRSIGIAEYLALGGHL